MSARASARPNQSTRARRPLAGGLAGLLVASGVTIVLAAAPASATPAPTPVADCSPTAATCTVTYGYSGSPDTFIVPRGVTSVDLDVYGAKGANNAWYNLTPGGLGGRTAGTLAVTPGDQIDLFVGQAGARGGLATYGGGGAAGGTQSYLGSGGGGSFVFTSGGDLLAAAGGGGGGGDQLAGGAGAGAGQNGGDGGVESFWIQYGDTPALGGTQTAGGAGGRNEAHFAFGAAGSGPAGGGVPGQGGSGGYTPYNQYYSGAGGGGGYYGGGGGGAFHGGAGGSGFAAPSLTDVTAQSGVRGGDGVITVSYERSATETTLSASPNDGSTEGDTVTLTATVSSTVATPTGAVAFTDGGSTIAGCGAVDLDGDGKAVCETSSFIPGSRSVVATYAGDTVLAPSGSTATTYTVAYKPLHVTTTSLPTGKIGQPYTAQLDAADGHGPYTWDVADGSLPPGVTLSSSGLLSGTPTGLGTGAPTTFRVTDSQDQPFTDSQAITLAINGDPAITARASSTGGVHNGWYRTPVTVRFTCTLAGSELVGTCPGPVVLSGDGAGQSVSRTIHDQDGGVATAALTGINVDRTAPSVKVVGKGRQAHCVATDALSGVAHCTLTRLGTSTVATATDRAGNRATSVQRRHKLTVLGATRHDGRFVVHAGSTYTIVAGGRDRPALLSVVPDGGWPRHARHRFHGTGHGRWVASMTVPRRAVGPWIVGVRSAYGRKAVPLWVVR